MELNNIESKSKSQVNSISKHGLEKDDNEREDNDVKRKGANKSGVRDAGHSRKVDREENGNKNKDKIADEMNEANSDNEELGKLKKRKRAKTKEEEEIEAILKEIESVSDKDAKPNTKTSSDCSKTKNLKDVKLNEKRLDGNDKNRNEMSKTSTKKKQDTRKHDKNSKPIEEMKSNQSQQNALKEKEDKRYTNEQQKSRKKSNNNNGLMKREAEVAHIQDDDDDAKMRTHSPSKKKKATEEHHHQQQQQQKDEVSEADCEMRSDEASDEFESESNETKAVKNLTKQLPMVSREANNQRTECDGGEIKIQKIENVGKTATGRESDETQSQRRKRRHKKKNRAAQSNQESESSSRDDLFEKERMITQGLHGRRNIVLPPKEWIEDVKSNGIRKTNVNSTNREDGEDKKRQNESLPTTTRKQVRFVQSFDLNSVEGDKAENISHVISSNDDLMYQRDLPNANKKRYGLGFQRGGNLKSVHERNSEETATVGAGPGRKFVRFAPADDMKTVDGGKGAEVSNAASGKKCVRFEEAGDLKAADVHKGAQVSDAALGETCEPFERVGNLKSVEDCQHKNASVASSVSDDESGNNSYEASRSEVTSQPNYPEEKVVVDRFEMMYSRLSPQQNFIKALRSDRIKPGEHKILKISREETSSAAKGIRSVDATSKPQLVMQEGVGMTSVNTLLGVESGATPRRRIESPGEIKDETNPLLTCSMAEKAARTLNDCSRSEQASLNERARIAAVACQTPPPPGYSLEDSGYINTNTFNWDQAYRHRNPNGEHIYQNNPFLEYLYQNNPEWQQGYRPDHQGDLLYLLMQCNWGMPEDNDWDFIYVDTSSGEDDSMIEYDADEEEEEEESIYEEEEEECVRRGEGADNPLEKGCGKDMCEGREGKKLVCFDCTPFRDHAYVPPPSCLPEVVSTMNRPGNFFGFPDNNQEIMHQRRNLFANEYFANNVAKLNTLPPIANMREGNQFQNSSLVQNIGETAPVPNPTNASPLVCHPIQALTNPHFVQALGEKIDELQASMKPYVKDENRATEIYATKEFENNEKACLKEWEKIGAMTNIEIASGGKEVDKDSNTSIKTAEVTMDGTVLESEGSSLNCNQERDVLSKDPSHKNTKMHANTNVSSESFSRKDRVNDEQEQTALSRYSKKNDEDISCFANAMSENRYARNTDVATPSNDHASSESSKDGGNGENKRVTLCIGSSENDQHFLSNDNSANENDKRENDKNELNNFSKDSSAHNNHMLENHNDEDKATSVAESTESEDDEFEKGEKKGLDKNGKIDVVSNVSGCDSEMKESDSLNSTLSSDENKMMDLLLAKNGNAHQHDGVPVEGDIIKEDLNSRCDERREQSKESMETPDIKDNSEPKQYCMDQTGRCNELPAHVNNNGRADGFENKENIGDVCEDNQANNSSVEINRCQEMNKAGQEKDDPKYPLGDKDDNLPICKSFNTGEATQSQHNAHTKSNHSNPFGEFLSTTMEKVIQGIQSFEEEQSVIMKQKLDKVCEDAFFDCDPEPEPVKNCIQSVFYVAKEDGIDGKVNELTEGKDVSEIIENFQSDGSKSMSIISEKNVKDSETELMPSNEQKETKTLNVSETTSTAIVKQVETKDIDEVASILSNERDGQKNYLKVRKLENQVGVTANGKDANVSKVTQNTDVTRSESMSSDDATKMTKVETCKIVSVEKDKINDVKKVTELGANEIVTDETDMTDDATKVTEVKASEIVTGEADMTDDATKMTEVKASEIVTGETDMTDDATKMTKGEPGDIFIGETNMTNDATEMREESDIFLRKTDTSNDATKMTNMEAGEKVTGKTDVTNDATKLTEESDFVMVEMIKADGGRTFTEVRKTLDEKTTKTVKTTAVSDFVMVKMDKTDGCVEMTELDEIPLGETDTIKVGANRVEASDIVRGEEVYTDYTLEMKETNGIIRHETNKTYQDNLSDTDVISRMSRADSLDRGDDAKTMKVAEKIVVATAEQKCEDIELVSSDDMLVSHEIVVNTQFENNDSNIEPISLNALNDETRPETDKLLGKVRERILYSRGGNGNGPGIAGAPTPFSVKGGTGDKGVDSRKIVDGCRPKERKNTDSLKQQFRERAIETLEQEAAVARDDVKVTFKRRGDIVDYVINLDVGDDETMTTDGICNDGKMTRHNSREIDNGKREPARDLHTGASSSPSIDQRDEYVFKKPQSIPQQSKKTRQKQNLPMYQPPELKNEDPHAREARLRQKAQLSQQFRRRLSELQDQRRKNKRDNHDYDRPRRNPDGEDGSDGRALTRNEIRNQVERKIAELTARARDNEKEIQHIYRVLGKSDFPRDEKGQIKPHCLRCGRVGDKRLRACKRCLVAKYCSKECQVANYPDHKDRCLRLKKWRKTQPVIPECLMVRMAEYLMKVVRRFKMVPDPWMDGCNRAVVARVIHPFFFHDRLAAKLEDMAGDGTMLVFLTPDYDYVRPEVEEEGAAAPIPLVRCLVGDMFVVVIGAVWNRFPCNTVGIPVYDMKQVYFIDLFCETKIDNLERYYRDLKSQPELKE